MEIDESNVNAEEALERLRKYKSEEEQRGLSSPNYTQISFSPNGVFLATLSVKDEKEEFNRVEIHYNQLNRTIESLKRYEAWCKARIEKGMMNNWVYIDNVWKVQPLLETETYLN